MERLKSLKDFKSLEGSLRRQEGNGAKVRASVCCGLPCTALGSQEIARELADESARQGIEVDIVKTGCQGLCQKGPLMQVEPHGYFYQKVKPERAGEMISKTMGSGQPVREFLYRDSFLDEVKEQIQEVPFYSKQVKIALRNTGKVDPHDIHQYIAAGGFKAVKKMFSRMSPDDVLEEVKKANLRGRGGAGFPAGFKWAQTKRSGKGVPKLVIANGDEGDPGAFMDRSIMEGDPFSLLEGMLICAYSIDANFGFIYVRHEYPLAIKTLEKAIKQAEEMGLLGRNILGTGFDFSVFIKEGAGAFVCGEATSLVASLEGQRGFPRARPPRLSEVGGGAWGYPSNLNNIETYACVPPIIEKGADWFLGIGTPGSPGTKVFSLAGKVNNTGLVEVPMGITLREIVDEIGGGILNNRKFKAIQTGGPSGGCIPEQYLDLPVDFDSLWQVGSMMGSGGMVVMDESDCMVDIAKFFLAFCQSESCGKCPPCRVGTYQMLQIMERITSGEGQPGDIERLEKLIETVGEGSLCGLGRSAPNPVATTLRYFREEYEEHIHDKYCRANVCSGMGVFTIDQKACILCGLCRDACAFDAVRERRSSYFIDQEYCTKCKACFEICPVGAVKVKKKAQIAVEKIKIPYEAMVSVKRKAKLTLWDVLKSKPHVVITIYHDSTVADAIRTLHDRNVSSVFVVDDNAKLIGIFTERDVVHCYNKGFSCQDTPVGHVARKDLIKFEPSMGISSAILIASRNKKRHMPIVDGDRILGMVTFRDLVSYLLPEISYI